MSATDLKPTVTGKSNLASRYAVRVNPDPNAAADDPNWVPVFGIFNLQPQTAYTMQDNSDFDADGWGSDFPTQRKWSMNLSVRCKSYSGSQDAGQAILEDAGEGEEVAEIGVQWFERNGGDRAYQGVAYSQWQPQGGDATAEDTAQVVLNGQGAKKKITNPAASGAVPSLSAATPAGQSAGEVITVTGTYLGGVTAVNVGADTASFVVINDSTLAVVLPAAATGDVEITVTNSAGTSEALTYTVGA